jgi:hypothetical protein
LVSSASAAHPPAASTPLAHIDRTAVNERVVIGCRTPGEGFFSHALKRELARRGIDVPFVDYDLVGEIRGARQTSSSPSA